MLALTISMLLVAAAKTEKPAPDYAKQVEPILRKYCVGCHNPTDREGKLSLESFQDLQKGGANGAAIVPGQSASSRAIRMLTGKLEPKMPPESEKAPTAEEIALLAAWIDAGAKGPAGIEPDRRTLLTPTIRPRTGLRDAIAAMDWSADGLLVLGRYAEVELVDPETMKTVRRLESLPGKVNAVHFSPDGKKLLIATGVTGLSGQAILVNVEDGKTIREFAGHRDVLYDAELSPDGKLVATCSYDRAVILWDAATGKQVRRLDGHNDAIYDLAFSPDSAILATASGDATIKVWSVATGERLDTLSQPLKEQYVVTFSPDGQYVLGGGADNRIRVWRLVSRTKPQINPIVHARFAHEGPIVQLRFSQDGKTLVSVAEDRTIKLWETQNYTERHLYKRQPDVVSGLALEPAGESFAVARMDGSLEKLDVIVDETASTKPLGTVAPVPMGDMPPIQDVAEKEPNDALAAATAIPLPAKIRGVVQPSEGKAKDVDLFRFEAKAGQQWLLEVNAARNKSPLDSKLEVVDAAGNRVPRVLLQAVRDSYFTFRGKDSSTSDDFRVHNWEEMELNEYLYSNGEVVKLWLYPRGPDSGFKVYPGGGARYTYFDTSPLSHPLGEPCYIVQPHAPGTKLIPNGLPVFPVYYENDDDGKRELGSDSRLTFTAPADGAYYVRLTDVRGFGGDKFSYELTVRPPRPDFRVRLDGANPTVDAGSGREFSVTVDRVDGFEGEVRVQIDNLPPGFFATNPVVIEAGQKQAFGTINALPDAPALTPENAKGTKVTATAMIGGKEVKHDVNNLGEIKLGAKPKVLARILPPDSAGTAEPPTPAKPLELVVAPGETITAKVVIERNGFNDRVSFGNEDSGRNLPHGVYVDNIGLNGLLIVEGKSEREFFITAAKWVPEMTRPFHLMARVEGNQTSWPVILHVRRKDKLAKSQ